MHRKQLTHIFSLLLLFAACFLGGTLLARATDSDTRESDNAGNETASAANEAAGAASETAGTANAETAGTAEIAEILAASELAESLQRRCGRPDLNAERLPGVLDCNIISGSGYER